MTARASRRGLFGGGASLMLLAAAAAGQAKAEELDGELLALCGRFCAAEAAYRHHTDTSGFGEMPPSDPRHPPLAAVNCALGKASHELLWEIAEHPARTPEGLRAKAEAVHAYFGNDPPEEGSAGGEALWSLVCDLVGKPGV